MLTSQWFWRTLTRTQTQFGDEQFIIFVATVVVLQLFAARRAMKSVQSNPSKRRFALGK